MAVIDEVTTTYEKVRSDVDYLNELDRLQRNYTGRPSPLFEATRLRELAGGARIFLAPPLFLGAFVKLHRFSITLP